MAHIAERLAELRQAERPDGKTWDRGWYDAITAAVVVARNFAAEPDPCRELAEWLVSLDDPVVRRDLPYHLSESAAVVLAARARHALGRTEEG